ncbi:MAG: hypothetical protein ABI324_19680 [Ktedonobacteraceae bacterium]
MTRLFIHFQRGEDLPQAGDVVQTVSPMTDITYETTIERVIAVTPLDNGMTRLTIDGTRREVSPSNVIQMSEHQ